MSKAAKPNPLFEIVITIIVPAVILMKLSGDSRLGAINALLVLTKYSQTGVMT